MKSAPVIGEHEFEPVEGLPEAPPEDERILWRGKPSWTGLAYRVFHVRKVAIYFAILLAWGAASGYHDGQTLADVGRTFAMMAPIAAVTVGVLCLLAWFYARTTVYTITSKRLVMRFGMALTLTVNLPFSLVKSADMRICGDGTGDLPLDFGGQHRVGYIHMWPFVRPMKFARPQPMLRAVKNPEKVAQLLADAIAGNPVTFMEEKTEAQQAPGMMPEPAE
ncbi:photosynthetic complex putative assembly protein PuhB [Hwanghaeella sp. LZ110]|uniref:photosynthetic complex putative assembly protein PuhB n=1 Tax=Hwanghaeella sp. LZ110 TaxID=3402810 RepID=UPI003B66F42A